MLQKRTRGGAAVSDATKLMEILVIDQLEERICHRASLLGFNLRFAGM